MCKLTFHRAVRRRLNQPFTIDRKRRLAIIIPVRERDEHLAVLLGKLRATLTAQAIDYRIHVVEQAPGKLFSRARIINVGANMRFGKLRM